MGKLRGMVTTLEMQQWAILSQASLEYLRRQGKGVEGASTVRGLGDGAVAILSIDSQGPLERVPLLMLGGPAAIGHR